MWPSAAPQSAAQREETHGAGGCCSRGVDKTRRRRPRLVAEVEEDELGLDRSLGVFRDDLEPLAREVRGEALAPPWVPLEEEEEWPTATHHDGSTGPRGRAATALPNGRVLFGTSVLRTTGTVPC